MVGAIIRARMKTTQFRIARDIGSAVLSHIENK